MLLQGDAGGSETEGLISFYNLSLNIYSKSVSETEILEYLDLDCGAFLKCCQYPFLLGAILLLAVFKTRNSFK